MTVEESEKQLFIPPRGVAQALRGFITNAQDATTDSSPVQIEVNSLENDVVVKVIDSGRGMEKDVLKRVGEPFFSTKAPGSGMGLGVFLGIAVFERLGGDVKVTSEIGQGTVVRVTLPHRVRPGDDQRVSDVSSNSAEYAKKALKTHQPLL